MTFLGDKYILLVKNAHPPGQNNSQMTSEYQNKMLFFLISHFWKLSRSTKIFTLQKL